MIRPLERLVCRDTAGRSVHPVTSASCAVARAATSRRNMSISDRLYPVRRRPARPFPIGAMTPASKSELATLREHPRQAGRSIKRNALRRSLANISAPAESRRMKFGGRSSPPRSCPRPPARAETVSGVRPRPAPHDKASFLTSRVRDPPRRWHPRHTGTP